METLGLTVGDISVITIIGIATFLGMALGLIKAILFVFIYTKFHDILYNTKL